MKRRKTGRKAAKTRTARKPARRQAVAPQDTASAQIARERDEALLQQAATAEILKLISASSTDTQPVFDAIVQSGLKLFPDAAVLIVLPDGDKLRAAAFADTDSARAKRLLRVWPIPLTRAYNHGIAILDRRMIDIPDARDAPSEHASGAQYFLKTGYRAITIMPMMRGAEAVGALSVVRAAPGKLSKRQVAALRAYAAQALIAIENTRLLNELRQRTDDLSESLEQQTATSEILKVISGSPGELEPVFQTILENATQICEAQFGALFRSEGDAVRCVGMHNPPKAYAEERRRNPLIRPAPATVFGRALATKRPVQIADIRDEIQSSDVPSGYAGTQLATLAGARTVLAVPMVKDAELIGGILIFRQEVREFTDKQIELVSNFAAQAVIAIENARLLNELRERTDDLSESLEQQTATSEVLKVVSASPGDMKPVFEAMLSNALRICEAKFGHILLYDGERFHATHLHDVPPAYRAYWEKHGPIRPGPNTGLGQIAREKRMFHIPDLKADVAYAERESLRVVTVEKAGARSFVGVPMLKDDKLIGAIVIYRQEVRPFTERQIELLQNFAAQAVIAIENTRLLNELRQRTDDLTESLEQQTATSEVLGVISSSVMDAQPVFDMIAENATKLCDAQFCFVYRFDGELLHFVAHRSVAPEVVEINRRKYPAPPNRNSVASRAILERKIVQIPDVGADPEYGLAEMAALAGYRSAAAVPILRDGAPVGCIAVTRAQAGLLADRQVELLKTFADQAVIAIENARLLNELRQRTEDLSESLEQQTATSEVLSVISSSQGELETVFRTLLENATRICDAAFGSMLQLDGDMFRRVALHNAPAAFAEFHARAPLVDPQKVSDLKRLVETRQIVHVADTAAEHPDAPIAKYAGGRTLLIVPMVRDEELIGAIGIYRQEVRPFTDKQIELVKNFASQAVIAIENARLLNELRESLQQQTATSDVLKVISRSTFDLQTVLDTLVESAARLCGAEMANIWRPKDGGYRLTASYGVTARYKEYLENKEFLNTIVIEPGRGTSVGRVLLEKKTVHIHDIQADPDYKLTGLVKLGGYRTMLGVPILREGEPIGVFVMVQSEVRPFTDKQIDLATTFADQAAIAIENVRLFDEVQARTRDLSESLQQQIATADVLKVISRSTFDLTAVLRTLVESATRLCEAEQAIISQLGDDGLYRLAANHGFPSEFEEWAKQNPFKPERGTITGRTALEGKVVHVPDVLADPEYTFHKGQKLGGYRSNIGVPLLRDGVVIGVFVLTRPTVKPFTDKQIELVRIFADQAVIAIENARLLSELRESLQQQTATAEVLKVISSSTGELQPVFDAMLENAVRICEAGFANLWLHDGKDFKPAAIYGAPSEYRELLQKELKMRPGAGTPIAGVIETKRPMQIADLAESESYRRGDPVVVASVKIAGTRSLVAVPMLKDNELVGAIAIYRREVRPFTDKQIELVSNFAAQAVIAIENARLLNELRESLQQQTATADVLKVISRSTFDLQAVLDTLVESAARVCEADTGIIRRREGDIFPVASTFGLTRDQQGLFARYSAAPDRGSVFGRAILEKRTIHVPDLLSDPDLDQRRLRDYAGVANMRSGLGVPLMREGAIVGVFTLQRREARPFTDKQIELVTTFADQAVIAIENVRLFDEVQARTSELAASLEDLRTAQDRLVQTQKLASLGQLTAGIAHEIKNPLNFVNNFSAISTELIDELQDTLKGISLDPKRRAEVDELTSTLRSNLDKVVQHGKRADGIVKNMLLHSREGTGEHRVVDVNALVEESLNLAYHGARAEKQGFNITLERSFDASAGMADLFPQEITRVLLNLIVNGFYAATKRKAEAGGNGYEPTLMAGTRSLGDSVEIRIRDNGTGIPPDVREKIFNPFFTTKPAGEGTGLGLSLSHDIVVKQHGGSIEVDTRPGEFTEFRIILPRSGTTLAKTE
jgi:GAF domain-containing protein